MASGVSGYEQVFVDNLSEGEWGKWKRGVQGDIRVLGKRFVVTELGARNQIAAYLGWSWVEWGGVGLARLHFWLQKADFGLLREDEVLTTC